MEVPNLKSENFHHKNQADFASKVPDILHIAFVVGKYKFCLDKKIKYEQINLEEDEAGENFFLKIVKRLNKTSRFFIWIFAFGVATVTNTSIAKLAIRDNVGDNLENTLSVMISGIFIYIIDLIISSNIKIFYSHRDAKTEQNILIESDRSSKNESIKQEHIKGSDDAFTDVQKESLSSNKWKFRASAGVLTIYFSSEFFASVYQSFEYKTYEDELFLLIFIAPLLSAMINIFSGYIRGISISYPGERSLLSKKYKIETDRFNKDEILDDINLMNHLSDIYISNPEISTKELSCKRAEYIFDKEIDIFKNSFNNELNSIIQQYGQSKNTQNKLSLLCIEKILDHIDSSVHSADDLKLKIKDSQCSVHSIDNLIEFIKSKKDNYKALKEIIDEREIDNLISDLVERYNSNIEAHNNFISDSKDKLNLYLKENNTKNDFSDLLEIEEHELEEINEKIKFHEDIKFKTDHLLSEIQNIKVKLKANNYDINNLGNDDNFFKDQLDSHLKSIDILNKEKEKKIINRGFLRICSSARKVSSQLDNEIQKIEKDCYQSIQEIMKRGIPPSSHRPLNSNPDSILEKNIVNEKIKFTRIIISEINLAQSKIKDFEVELTNTNYKENIADIKKQIDKKYSDYQKKEENFEQTLSDL